MGHRAWKLFAKEPKLKGYEVDALIQKAFFRQIAILNEFEKSALFDGFVVRYIFRPGAGNLHRVL